MESKPKRPDPSADRNTDQDHLDRLLSAHIKPLGLPTDSLQTLSDRLQSRVALSAAEHQRLLTVRAKQGVWRTLKQGVRYKTLWEGKQGNSVLVEFAPGASLPPHRHNWLEEGIVLAGGLQTESLELGVFDYQASPAGSRHGAIASRQGALAYLRGTSLGKSGFVGKELLGGLLPFSSAKGHTVFASPYNEWQPLATGVSIKMLHDDGVTSSSLIRLDAGAEVDSHAHSQDEECMMLAGELFFGDMLLMEGDYQLAPAGTEHGKIYSDVGALLFRRGSTDY